MSNEHRDKQQTELSKVADADGPYKAVFAELPYRIEELEEETQKLRRDLLYRIEELEEETQNLRRDLAWKADIG